MLGKTAAADAFKPSTAGDDGRRGRRDPWARRRCVPSTNSLMCCCECEEGRHGAPTLTNQRNRGGTPRHAVEMVEDGGRPRGRPWRRKEADVADRASGRRRLHAATARPQASTDRNGAQSHRRGAACRAERQRMPQGEAAYHAASPAGGAECLLGRQGCL